MSWRRNETRLVTAEVIGVVAGVKWDGLPADAPPTIYWSARDRPSRDISIVVRTPLASTTVAELVANALQMIDPNQALADVRPMEALVAADLARPRLSSLLTSLFAGVALFTASIGLYGVVSFNVAQRTRKIGILMALGTITSFEP